MIQSPHVVILAGGMGTRMRPFTQATPKPMLPFLGQPTIVGWLQRLADEGFQDAHLALGPEASPFRDAIGAARDLGLTVHVHNESRPRGSGGALRPFRGARAPVVVINADIVTGASVQDILAAHVSSNPLGTLLTTHQESAEGFGTVESADGLITRFAEKATPRGRPPYRVNAGVYVLSPGLLSHLPARGPASLERALFPALANGGELREVYTDAGWADLGTPHRYLHAHLEALGGGIPWPFPAGVTEREPGLWCGPGVVLRAGARLVPPAILVKDADVGAGSVIGPHAVVGTGVTVGARSVVRDSVLLERVEIGPDRLVSSQIVSRCHSVRVVSGAPAARPSRCA